MLALSMTRYQANARQVSTFEKHRETKIRKQSKTLDKADLVQLCNVQVIYHIPSEVKTSEQIHIIHRLTLLAIKSYIRQHNMGAQCRSKDVQ